MLWRQSYTTRIEERRDIPPLDIHLLNGTRGTAAPFVVAVRSLRAMPALDLWRRLFRERYPTMPAMFAVVGATDLADLEALVPPSRSGEYGVIRSPEWIELFDGADEQHPMAIVAGHPSLVLIGPPTEDAWEACWPRLDTTDFAE